MSADGQRIFFATPDALVPEDINGEAGCPVQPDTGYPGDSKSYTLRRCLRVARRHPQPDLQRHLHRAVAD